MKLRMKNHTVGLIFTVLIFYTIGGAQSAQAEGHKQHKAHVHGIAHLNLALDHHELYIEFISPAADIVGFEHTPKTEKEKSAMQKALGKLRVGDRIFTFSPGADVRFEKAVVQTGLQHECEHDHGHEKNDSHHHDSDHHDHSHDKHDSDHHDHKSHDHESHNHGEDAHGQHSDIAIEYRFHCETPGKLEFIDVKFFEYFKSLEKIKVQVLTQTRQTAVELTPKNTKILF